MRGSNNRRSPFLGLPKLPRRSWRQRARGFKIALVRQGSGPRREACRTQIWEGGGNAAEAAVEPSGGLTAPAHVSALTGAKVRIFLTEVAEGVSGYLSKHSVQWKQAEERHAISCLSSIRPRAVGPVSKASRVSRSRYQSVLHHIYTHWSAKKDGVLDPFKRGVSQASVEGGHDFVSSWLDEARCAELTRALTLMAFDANRSSLFAFEP